MRLTVLFVILLLTAATLVLAQTNNTLHVGSFNIQVLGRQKVSNPQVTATLVTILRRYDLCLVQEIRDNTDTAMQALLAQLNAVSPTPYEMVMSPKLGRSNSKEQYAFLYNPRRVAIEKTFQFPDPQNWFERPPFSVLVRSKTTGARVFLTGIHIRPDDTANEMNHLVDVFMHYITSTEYPEELRKIILDNWFVMGDFNADCKYTPKKVWPTIRLRTLPDFKWLIADGEDTTVSEGRCAYDRIVTTMKTSPSQGSVFRFDSELNLSMQQAKLVSDHYPIEMRMANF